VLTPSSGAVGFGRALLWAAVVLALALTAHFEAGGHLPPVEVIALLGALLLVVTTMAVRRQVRWPGGLALAGLGQYALHQAFSFLGGACAPVLLPDGLADGGAHPHLAGSVTGPLAHGACVGVEPAVMGTDMLAWHAVATVVTVGLLVGVERGVWLLASWLVRPLSVEPLWLPVVRRAPVPPAPGAPSGSVDLHVAPERGPPSRALLMHLAA
jgi:hypothetical protein